MKSKFEKNSMLKKIVAIICTIALLMSIAVPCNVLAAGKNIKTITLIYKETPAEGLVTSYLGIAGNDPADLFPGDTYKIGRVTVEATTNATEEGEPIANEDGNCVWTLAPATASNFNGATKFTLEIFANYQPQVTQNDGTTFIAKSQDEGDGFKTYTVEINLSTIVDENYILTVGPAPATQYDVRVFNGSNTASGSYTVSDVTVGDTQVTLANNSFKAEENKIVKFKVLSTAGYKIDSVVVSSETFPLVADTNGYYSFKATKDAMITVTTSNAQYTISGLKAPKGYTLLGDNIDDAGKTTVEHGKSYSFTVVAPDGMQDADVSISGSATLTSYNGQWMIRNITGNVAVSIEAGKEKTYDVTLPDERIGYSIVTDSTSVTHGGSYTFKINVADKYNESTPKVTVNGKNVNYVESVDNTYTYTLENITEDTTVSVSGITRNPYVISGLANPGEDEEGGYTVTGSSPISKDGKATTSNNSYEFYVKADAGYGTPTVSVKGGDAVIANPREGTYIINNITDDVTVTITRGSKKTYNVRFTNGTGYQFNKTAATIEHETGTLDFSISLDSAYSQSATKIKLNITSGNGDIVDNGDLTYTITNVTADTTISVDSSTIKLNTYTISGLKSVEGSYTVQGTFDTNGIAQVNHGGSYTFYVNSAAGLKDPTVTVSDNKTFIKNGNQYTIENITSNLSVTIEAGTTLAYDVTLNTTEGCNFVDTDGKVVSSKSVDYGKSFAFKLEAIEGYDVTNAVVQVDGKNLTPGENGLYTISNITANTIVSVSGVTKRVYKVTLTQTEGYTITSSSLSVSYGDDFHFTVAVNTGYEFVEVQVGDKKLEGGKVGMNTITGVKSDLKISVIVSKISYAVTINKGEFTTTKINNTVDYGKDVSFTVTPNSYYKVTRVTVNGTEYFADSTGTYTITNVTTNMSINVATAPVTITINYIGGRWADNKTKTYTYDGKAALEKSKLEKVVSSEILYAFNGWIIIDGDLNFDTEKDKTITLEADWVDNIEFIRDNIVLETYHQTASSSSVTIRTYVNVSELKYNQAFQGSKILAYGTLLTKADVDNKDIYALKDYVLNGTRISGNEDGTGLMIEGIRDKKGNAILNYYHTDTVIDPLEMGNDNFIRLAMTGFSPDTVGDYKALGWIKIQIGNETVIVFCDYWDTGFAQSTDPKYVKS